MRPDVSIVIAAWNASDTLPKTLDSALSQRGVSREVIVVDDCSTDGTADVVRNRPEAGLRLVQLDRNSGPACARNAGFDAAQGDWVAVLDADDTMASGRLARLIGLAEARNAHIVADNLEIVRCADDNRRLMFARKRLAALRDLRLSDFIDGNRMFAGTFSLGYIKPIFQRQFLQQHRLHYDTALRIGEDYVLLADALALGARCLIDPEPGYRYAVRAGSISRVLELPHVDEMLAAEARFEARHKLSAVDQAAQARRKRSLKDAKAFLEIVDGIKQRAPIRALDAARRAPRALRHFRMPLAVRLRRAGRWMTGWDQTSASSTHEEKMEPR